MLQGEVSWDGGHGSGEGESGLGHLVRHDVGAAEGEILLRPLAHVPRGLLCLHGASGIS